MSIAVFPPVLRQTVCVFIVCVSVCVCMSDLIIFLLFPISYGPYFRATLCVATLCVALLWLSLQLYDVRVHHWPLVQWDQWLPLFL